MRESVITGILSFFCGVLLIGAVVGIYLQDRAAPEITLNGKNTMVYVEGDDRSHLLKDVKAIDNEDGDVSSSLRVSDIYVTSEDRAMVIYVAKDQSNNIAKLKREVKYAQRKSEHLSEEQISAVTTAAPRMVLFQNEATLKIGETFSIYRYIQSAVDANGNDISRSMHINGTYNVNEAGVYPLQIYALDGNGKSTDIETFTLTVIP